MTASFSTSSPRIALVLATLLLAAGCASGKFRSGAKFDTSYDFEAVETFAFDPRREKVAGSPTGQLVQQALREELVARGYREAPKDQADVLISYDVGVYADARVSGNTRLKSTEGGLTVWVFDRETGANVWYGWSERVLSSDDEPKETVERAVEVLFENRVPRND